MVAEAPFFLGEELGSGRKPPRSTERHTGPAQGAAGIPGTDSQPPAGTTDISFI